SAWPCLPAYSAVRTGSYVAAGLPHAGKCHRSAAAADRPAARWTPDQRTTARLAVSVRVGARLLGLDLVGIHRHADRACVALVRRPGASLDGYAFGRGVAR